MLAIRPGDRLEGIMRPCLAILGFVVLSSLPLPARAALVPPDPVASGLSDATCPVLAFDLTSNVPHLAYVDGGSLHHAWKVGGVWQDEVVASGLPWDSSIPFESADLQVAPGGVVVALYRDATRLVCARRVSGTWLSDSLDAMPGIGAAALAISPVTGEPVVTWGKRHGGAGTPVDFKLARRDGGVWTTQLFDTSPVSQTRVAVGVDLLDRPRVAWSRPREDARNARVLMSAMFSGSIGSFTSAVVDSELSGYVSLAVDPLNGDPRVAYDMTTAGNERRVRYASHDGGTWQHVDVSSFTSAQASPSLVVDANGDPFIGLTRFTDISPQDVRAGDLPEQNSCFVVSTGSVQLWHRTGGTGLGAFSAYATVHGPPSYTDLLSGPRAVATPWAGSSAVVVRTPHMSACAPYDVGFALTTPTAGVEPGPGARVALQPLAPNPLRVGEAIRVRFTLERAAGIAVELHDAAGRLVEERAAGDFAVGARELHWTPAVARPGLYWLTVRAGGTKLGTRAAVVVN
jgi:hypothetical protein